MSEKDYINIPTNDRKVTINGVNSNTKPKTPDTAHDIKPVVGAPIQLRERSKFAVAMESLFIGNESLFGRLFMTVVVPHIKSAIYESITAGTHSVLFHKQPQARPGGVTPLYGNNGTPYNTIYINGATQTQPKPAYQPAGPGPISVDIRRIPVPDYATGQDILESLSERIQWNGKVTVQDLYITIGLDESTVPFTMVSWGWTDISTAKVVSDRNGWVLYMPKVTHLQ